MTLAMLRAGRHYSDSVRSILGTYSSLMSSLVMDDCPLASSGSHQAMNVFVVRDWSGYTEASLPADAMPTGVSGSTVLRRWLAVLVVLDWLLSFSAQAHCFYASIKVPCIPPISKPQAQDSHSWTRLHHLYPSLCATSLTDALCLRQAPSPGPRPQRSRRRPSVITFL